MITKPIKSETDYNKALKRLNDIFEAKRGTPEADEAEILVLLIEKYEEEKYPIPSLDPIEAIKERVNFMNLKQKDLIGILGTKSQVSEVLNKKKRMTVEMIRNVESKLRLPASLLIQHYALDSKKKSGVLYSRKSTKTEKVSEPKEDSRKD